MKKTGKLTALEKGSYSLSALGREVSTIMVSAFFMLFLTAYVGLNGTVVGILICLAKIWDAINDPIIATMVNNTKTKIGRYKPWIIVGTFLNCFFLVFMFFPIEGSMTLKYVFYMMIYVLWGMSFTCVDVPFWSMIPSIANTTEERNSVASISKLFAGFGGLICGSGGTVIITNLVPNGSKNNKCYFYVALVMCAVFIVFMASMFIFNKEHYPQPADNTRLRDIFKIFKGNDQLIAYAVSYVLFQSAWTIALIQPIYLFVYDYRHLYLGLYIVFNVLACTFQGIVMIFYPLIVKKIKREKLFAASYIIAILGLISMFLIFFVLKEIPYEQGATEILKGYETATFVNIILISIAGTLLYVSAGIVNIGSTVMIADVCDYGQWKTGKRTDSIIFSVQTLVGKFATAISTLILGIATSVSGLPAMVQTLNEKGEAIYSFSGVVSDEMLMIFRVFMYLVPVPIMIIGYIYYKKKYKLYGEYYDNIKNDLK